jgi:hypothetical protein
MFGRSADEVSTIGGRAISTSVPESLANFHLPWSGGGCSISVRRVRGKRRDGSRWNNHSRGGRGM